MDHQHEERGNSNEHDEPIILSFEAFTKGGIQPDQKPSQPINENQPQDDDFWAGRNLAMRRSARWAA